MSVDDFTHLGKNCLPKMVDVGSKKITERTAVARTVVKIPEAIYKKLNSTETTRSSKGSIFDVAVLAGTQAAKKTSDLIPLCHIIPLDSVKIDLRRVEDQRIIVDCRVKATFKTGVEMEALVGSSIAALTVYDMCKALSHEIVIEETKLIEKTGGKNDYFFEDPKG